MIETAVVRTRMPGGVGGRGAGRLLSYPIPQPVASASARDNAGVGLGCPNDRVAAAAHLEIAVPLPRHGRLMYPLPTPAPSQSLRSFAAGCGLVKEDDATAPSERNSLQISI